jgi:hypothetical protein
LDIRTHFGRQVGGHGSLAPQFGVIVLVASELEAPGVLLEAPPQP